MKRGSRNHAGGVCLCVCVCEVLVSLTQVSSLHCYFLLLIIAPDEGVDVTLQQTTSGCTKLYYIPKNKQASKMKNIIFVINNNKSELDLSLKFSV